MVRLLMQEQLEEFINGNVFREKMEKMTRRTVEEVLHQQSHKLDETINKTIEATLSKLGVHVDEVHEVRKDFIHARNARKGCEFAKKNAFTAFITVTVPTICYFVGHAVLEKITTMIK